MILKIILLILMGIVALKIAWTFYEIYSPSDWCKKHNCLKREHGYFHELRCGKCYLDFLKEIAKQNEEVETSREK